VLAAILGDQDVDPRVRAAAETAAPRFSSDDPRRACR
jgi:hypothetical protein